MLTEKHQEFRRAALTALEFINFQGCEKNLNVLKSLVHSSARKKSWMVFVTIKFLAAETQIFQ